MSYDDTHAGHGCSADPLKNDPTGIRGFAAAMSAGAQEATAALNDLNAATEAAQEAPITAAQLAERARQLRVAANEATRQAKLAAAAEEAAKLPPEPGTDGEENPVVFFTKYQSGRLYAFAAVGWALRSRGDNVVRRWMVTGTNTERMNWRGLLEFIGEANWPSLVEMTGAQHLLPPGGEGPIREQMGRYGVASGPQSGAPVSPFTPPRHASTYRDSGYDW